MYKLDISKVAGKFIGQLDTKQFRQVVSSLLRLRENPEPHDSRELKGYSQYRRVDVGEYRIVYRKDEDTIYIALIGKRNDDNVYKRLNRLLS